MIEYAFRDPPEETRHPALEHVAPRTQERRAGREHLAERDEIVLVAAGAVQHQERGRPGNRRLLETVGVAQLGRIHGACTGGSSTSSFARIGSIHGGSLSAVPSDASGSSNAKPGASVAISNNTPPGSWK